MANDAEVQGSDEWKARRCGRITASRFVDMMARSKPKMEWAVLNGGDVANTFGGGVTGEKRATSFAKKNGGVIQFIQTSASEPLQAYHDYMAELVVERLTGKALGIPMTASLQWGVDLEPHARAAYEASLGVIVDQVGLIVHPRLPFVGASPDGLVGEDGGTESKCPFNSINHMDALINGMPAEHIPQVQGNLMVTGRKWWDFISYDPRMPEKMRLYVQRIPRDDAYIQKLEAACIELDRQVNEMIERLLKAVDN